jgi:hypothetical protein
LKRITEVKAGVLVVWWEFDGLVVDAMGDMIDVMVTIDHHAFSGGESYHDYWLFSKVPIVRRNHSSVHSLSIAP